MDPSIQPAIAPGARVVIRDAEWVIRKVDMSSDGGYQLTCDGVSELVQNKSGIFLTELEEEVQVLDPSETLLVEDDSAGYSSSQLYIESLLRRAVPNDDYIHIGHQAAMDSVRYQLDPALQALKQPRQRILIADSVGLGKTLEAGILVTELMRRGKGKRILVLALKSMLTQFQKEFWSRFTIPLTRLDSVGLQRVRNRIPGNHNPFYYYDKSIISIDTLKQDTEYRTYLEQAYWDIIIIDEAHNVAERGNSSMRARLAKLLATRSDTLIMLSATPHDGKARSFASLMNMLDPTAISDPDSYSKEDFRNKGLVIRRFKKDIQHQVDQEFKKNQTFKHYHPAGLEEEAAYEALLDIKFTRGGEYTTENASALLRVTLQKALFSSPAACLQSVEKRIDLLNKQVAEKASDDIEEEINGLLVLHQQLKLISPDKYAKYKRLIKVLKDKTLGWSARKTDDRLVIFSERIETLHFLEKQLKKDLKLKDNQVTLLYGEMSDVEQQKIVEAFGKPEEKVRVLLCSDVASEGINLHYLSHRLIHFDMPWSLMIFQQRNGRIDRYGQEQTPQIHFLITESENPVIRGDTRILEILEQKSEQAYDNIGDPSVFMGVYDIRDEEKITEAAIASGVKAEDFDNQLTPKKDEGENLLELFLGTGETTGEQSDVEPEPQETAQTIDTLSLFPSHYDYCVAALNTLNAAKQQVQFSHDMNQRRITLTATDDLQHRFSFFPREITPDKWQFVLTDDIETIKDEISRSRQDENAWPKIQYLWPLHPLLEWLDDRMLASVGRHQAPVIIMPEGLESGEVVFIISGLVPNRKSHPLIYEWLGVRFSNGSFKQIEPFTETLQRTGLGSRAIPNTGKEVDIQVLQALLPKAVEKARNCVVEKRDIFEADINKKLNRQLEELEALRNAQYRQLELNLGSSKLADTVKESRKAQRTQEIDRIFDQYIEWVEDTMTTEQHPYMQVVSVLVSGS